MPVFSVKEVAAAARKDEKTIRIWCAKGFVPGAKRKRGGPGRHWRIEGTNAATIAGLSLRAARGFSRQRKRTMSGKVVPNEFLQRVKKLKARLRARRDPALVLGAWAASRGESFDEGEVSLAVLLRADPAEALATALAHGMIERGTTKDAASSLGARLGWSRATFYRKFGNLLPMARRIADNYAKTESRGVSRQWEKNKNDGAGGYEAVEFGLDESNLSPEQIRLYSSMASYAGKMSK
jgi:hypothetical protein